MNQRIKELAEQSGLEIPDDTDYNGHIYRNALEKFAELIVKECLIKIENEADQYAEPVWAIELVDDIKEHFDIDSGYELSTKEKYDEAVKQREESLRNRSTYFGVE